MKKLYFRGDLDALEVPLKRRGHHEVTGEVSYRWEEKNTPDGEALGYSVYHTGDKIIVSIEINRGQPGGINLRFVISPDGTRQITD